MKVFDTSEEALERSRRLPRTLVLSQRNVERRTWQASIYEWEQVIDQVEDVDLLAPTSTEPWDRRQLVRRAMNRLRRQAGLPALHVSAVDRPIQPVRVDRDYELFFSVFFFPWDIARLERVQGWRDRSGIAVCVLVEFWTPWAKRYARQLRMLRDFDQIFVCNRSVIPLVEEATGRPCHYLPMGVDAIRFSPYPSSPPRTIDVYNFGRASADVHLALLQEMANSGIFYVHDTIIGDSVVDFEGHRALTANLMKRARFFTAFRINDSPERRERTGGDEALSTRLFEGAAGGAVLLGSRPLTPDFEACFGWDDAVVPVPYDGDGIISAIRALDAQPDRMMEVRRQNVMNSLRRHDWLYRWQEVLTIAGISGTVRLDERREHLEALALQVDRNGPTGRVDFHPR